MAKQVSTYWHDAATSSASTLLVKHQEQFMGNQLASLNGYYKVAHPFGTIKPAGALTTDEMLSLPSIVVTGNVTIGGIE